MAVAYWGNKVNQIQTAAVAEPVSFLMNQRHWNFLIWFSEKVLRRNVSLFKGSAMLNTSTWAPSRNLQGLSCEILAQESSNRTWTEFRKLRSKRTGMINLLLYWTRGANSFSRSFRCLSQTDILKWCKRTSIGQACELYSWCRSPNNLLAQQQYIKRDSKKFSLWAIHLSPQFCSLSCLQTWCQGTIIKWRLKCQHILAISDSCAFPIKTLQCTLMLLYGFVPCNQLCLWRVSRTRFLWWWHLKSESPFVRLYLS
jgi:hypothetical protein